MNKFFKSAVERYNNLLKSVKKDGFLINPISELDAEIIGELKIILDKRGVRDVVEIVNNYKNYKDEDIRDELLQWNIDHNQMIDEDDEDIENAQQRRMFYVKIKEVIIFQYDLKCFKFMEEIKNGEIKYQLMINPTPEEAKSVPYFANYIVNFDDEEDRDDTYSQLKSFLKENRINIIEL